MGFGRGKIRRESATVKQTAALPHEAAATWHPWGHAPLVVAGLGALLAVAIACLVIFGIWDDRKDALNKGELTAKNLARVIEAQTQHAFMSIALSLDNLDSALKLIPPGSRSRAGDIRALMKKAAAKQPHVRALFMADENGKILHGGEFLPASSNAVSEREYFRVHRHDPDPGIHIGPPIVSGEGKQFINVSRRINRIDGGFGGVVVAAVEPDYFRDFYSMANVGADGAIALLLNDGTLLFGSLPQVTGKSFADRMPFSERRLAAPSGTYHATSATDNTARIFSYRQVRGLPLVVVVGLGERQALSGWYSQGKAAFLRAVIFILAIVALTWLLVQQVKRREKLAAALLESERRYRYLFDANPHPMWIYDCETLEFLGVNDATLQTYGYSRREFLAMNSRDIRPQEEVPRFERLVASLDPKFNQSDSWRHKKKDGTLFEVEITSHGFRFEGRPARLVLAQDVSARVRAERQLRESEERYRSLFESSPMPMWLRENDTLRFLAVNEAAVAAYGYSKEEFFSLTVADLRLPEDVPHYLEIARAQNPMAVRHAIVRHRRKDGTPFDAEIISRPFESDGRPVRLTLVNDITERLRAEQALQESEHRYRELFDLNPTPMWVYDLGTLAILAVNEAAVQQYGYSREEFAAMTIPDMHVQEEVRELIGRVRRRDPDARFARQVHHRRKNGTVMDVEINTGPIVFRGRTARLVLANDITERKRAEIVRARLAAIVESSEDAIVSRTLDGTLLSWNRGAEKIFGYTMAEIVGQNISILSPPEFKHYAPRNTARLLKGEVVPPFETVRIAKDGRRVEVQVSMSAVRDAEGHIAGIASIFRDISERKRAEDAVVRERALLRAVVDTMPERIYVKDPEGRFLLQNATNLKLRGVRNHDDIVGKTVFDIFPREIAEALEAEDRAVLESGVPLINREGKTFFGSPGEQDSTVRWHVTSKIPLRDAAGNIIGIVGVNRDITARKRAEAERAFLSAIVENSAEAIISRTLDGTIMSWNAGAERMLGYSASEAIGREIYFALPSALIPGIGRNNESLLRGKAIAPHEIRSTTKDGRVIDLLSSVSPIRNDAGEIIGASVILHDITDRKQTEERLKQADRARRVLADCSHTLAQASSEAELLQEMCRIVVESGGYVQAWIGYAEEDEGKSVVPVGAAGFEPGYLESKTMSWAEDGRYPSLTGKIIASGRPYISRDILSDPNARHLVERAHRCEYRSMIGLPLFLEGKCIGGISIYAKEADAFGDEEVALLTTLAEDIAFGIKGLRTRIAHSKAEKALLRERVLLRSVIDNLPDHVYVKDRDRRYILVNETELTVWGLTGRDSMAGKTAFDYFPPQQAAQYDAEDRAVIETGKPLVKREQVTMRADGQKEWYLTTKVPLRSPGGETIGMIGINHDITQIRKSAEAIRQLNAELEQRVIERTAQLEATNKELESFAYSVSHDLRAPLRSIDGFSQALIEDYRGALDATGQDYLRRVRTATQRMALLIDDLLALSRITRGEMRRATTDLSALARGIVADIRKEQPQRAIDIKVARGMKPQADPRLLSVALDNLLRNAWKYTARQPNPQIEVGVEQKEGQPVYFVRDNGVGFDMRYAGKLFGAFQRLHSDSDFPGTGIGLATVQRIIRRHGGEIWAQAETGKGATFFFTFGNGVAP